MQLQAKPINCTDMAQAAGSTGVVALYLNTNTAWLGKVADLHITSAKHK